MQELLAGAHHTKVEGEDVGVAVGVAEMVDKDSPVVIRSRRMSKRSSLRDSTSDMDRQLKKLFRAIQDGDTNLVSGWLLIARGLLLLILGAVYLWLGREQQFKVHVSG